MASSPAATCLAFDPRDNNVVAIGMDDSTIMIYNARSDKVTSLVLVKTSDDAVMKEPRMLVLIAFVFQVTSTLEGHTKRVTCLAFSTSMKALVSSGADAQVKRKTLLRKN